MRPDSPSQTAVATAWLRALHLVVDDKPSVFADRLAQELLPAYQQRYLRRLGRLPESWLRTYRLRRSALTAMRSQIVVRARYTEDALALARDRGCNRYIVLAAGLDTFAMRQAASDSPINVIEIDHPATQRWKRDWLRTHGHEHLQAVEFLPVDFERSTLAEALADRGQQTQFISWLGTTYYLTEGAITATLRALAENSGAGSELVLDYWREQPVPDASSILLWGTRIATALQQEPMRSFFDPGAMQRIAEAAGWRVRENCPAAMQNQRYLSDRVDNLSVPSFAFLLHLER